MYLLSLKLFVLYLHITCISCKQRSTMEEDIARTDYAKIHKYEPRKELEKRQKMRFDKKFPISSTIIYPFKELLQQLENDVYDQMYKQIQHQFNETQESGIKILDKRLQRVVPPKVADLDKKLPNVSHNTHEAKLQVQESIDTTLPDNKKDLENIIQDVFRRLSDLYNNTSAIDNNIESRIHSRPGYCYVFGICSPIFCNCDN